MNAADTPSPRIVKRSVVVAGHRTSVSLEGPFWDELKRIAETKRVSLNQLVAEVDGRREGNLSSALRLLVLETLKAEIRSTTTTHG
ncbi:MAG: ribbon-helix-helix domain-containing protein [Rhodospirillaceae bacterium]|jgi:predicted DNA-binding ribbon-helix-helix protein|nr:ribbon-helix-helix domain-containing protein [Rhodospirillaceae bacterium]